MKFLTTTRLAAMVLLALAGAAGAQSETEQERRKMEIKAEEERRQVEIEAEQKLREAEIRLQEAAEEVARLTEGRTRRLVVNSSGGRLHGDGPKLGVALSSTRVNGERDGEGIKVMSVSPGSAAADAGILVGDRLLAVDTKSLTEVDTMEASLAIGKVLKDKEEGDSINLKVLRDGKPRTIKVTLNDQSFSTNSFAFAFGEGGRFDFPGDQVIRIEEGLARSMEGLEALEQDFEVAFAEQDGNFRFLSSGSAFSSMELVELSEGLGSYFGTDQGLLVVSAPSDEALGFVDGDVIKSIGGRIPKNVGHAMRILRSYSAGEDVKIEILRNRKKRTLDITVPERSGGLWKEKLMGRGGLPLIEWSGDSEVIIVDETEDSLL